MSTGLTSASGLITNISSSTLNVSTGITTSNNILQQVSNTSTSTYHEFNQSSGTVRGLVGLTIGSVILGSITNNPINFYVNNTNTGQIKTDGSLIITGDITGFGNLSDKKLKKNIQSINSNIALKTVMNLNPVLFDWKENIFNFEKQNKSDIGFIAQEIEEIIPLAVSEFNFSNEKFKTIKHERLIPYLVGAIKELYLIIQKNNNDNFKI